jgi:hypothetical protein
MQAACTINDVLIEGIILRVCLFVCFPGATTLLVLLPQPLNGL